MGIYDMVVAGPWGRSWQVVFRMMTEDAVRV